MGYRTLAAVLIMSASPAALAVAQDAAPAEDADSRQETIIVTGTTAFGATKSDTPIVETARTLSVETSEMFIDKGALNLASALTYVAGVTAEPYGFSTRGDFPQSRGLELPRYRDSIQELFGSYNSTRADLYTVEQIEVLKGPASVLYGQGSPGGIVNYVSKTPRDTFSGELRADVGNFDRYEVAGDVTGPIGGEGSPFAFRLVGLYRDTGTQIDQVDEETKVFMPSLSWQAAPDTKFTLIGLLQDTESDAAAQFIPVEGTLFPLADGTYLDTDVYAGEPGFNRYNTESQQVTLLGEHKINDNLMLEGTALWRSGEADYHQAWATFTGAGQSRYLNGIFAAQPALGAAAAAQGLSFTDTTVPRTFYQGDNEFDQLAADVRLRASFTTGAFDHDLLAGVQYQDVETDSDTASLYGGGALAGDFRYVLDLKNPVYGNYPDQSVFDALLNDTPAQTTQDVGVYVSDQIAVGKWRLTAGVRLDSVENEAGAASQEDDAVSTSFGVLYRFDNGFSPYASFSESFETVVGTTPQGAQLDPEEARQYEVGFKYEPRGIPGLITAAYYDIEISNLPNPNALPGNAAQQQGVSTLKGFEAEARLQFDEIYLQASASTIDAEDPNGRQLAAIPEEQASLWTTWRPDGAWDGFKAGVGVRYVGETVSDNGTISYTTPDYTLGDLMVGYEWDQWDFAVNARNVTDEDYLTGCLTRGDCFPGLRRTVIASLSYDF